MLDEKLLLRPSLGSIEPANELDVNTYQIMNSLAFQGLQVVRIFGSIDNIAED